METAFTHVLFSVAAVAQLTNPTPEGTFCGRIPKPVLCPMDEGEPVAVVQPDDSDIPNAKKCLGFLPKIDIRMQCERPSLGTAQKQGRGDPELP
jgi:hypothetical protein